MNSKKRYIPIVALGALLISLLAILPVAGAGEVSFIDPNDINNDNNGKLTDSRPEAQESARQGGQVGILYEDDDLNRPIRRALILGWDGTRADDSDGTTPSIVAHSAVVKNVQLDDIDSSEDGDQILESGDYVYVGDPDPTGTASDLRTVRKVVSVSVTSETRNMDDLEDRRYDITLDAAFPVSAPNQQVWRIKNEITRLDAFSENYRFISAAAIVAAPGTATDTIRLTAPITPSGIGNFTGNITAVRRLGGESDTRLSTDDVIVGNRSGTPLGTVVVDRVDPDRITFDDDLGTTGSLFIAYWAAERNSTGSDLSVQSQASSQPQGFTLQETAESSDQFSGKIDLIPASVTVPWSAFGTDDNAGSPYMEVDNEWVRDPAKAVGATVTLDGPYAGKRDLMVRYPSGWNLNDDDEPADRPEGDVEVDTVPDFSQRSSGEDQFIPRLPVNASDTVTVNYPDGSAALRVETAAPVFSNFNPPHNDVGDDSRPAVSAQVTDADSGLSESKVGIVFAIKPAGSTLARFAVGRNNDDDNRVKLAPNNADADPISGGYDVEARLNSAETLSADGEIWWWVKATDKAGNVAYSDQQPNTSDGQDDACTAKNENELQTDFTNVDRSAVKCDPYVIKVDGTEPKMSHAETGRWWDTSLSTGDSDDKTEYRRDKARANSILVIFDEPLDAATVQAADFEVNDATPSSADVQEVKVRNDNTDDSGDGNSAYYVEDAAPRFVGQTKGYVFLTLSQDMTPNAQPKVEMVGDVSDLAGNKQSTLQRDAQADDRIAPEITVSIEEGLRPVTRKDVTVRITSNENIGTPKVTFYKVDKTSPVDNPDTPNVDESTGASETTVGTEQKASARFVSAREYTATITPSGDGLYTVYVTASDSSGSNNGVAGHKTGATVDIDGDTKSILFERDKAIAAPDFDPDKSGVNTTFETDDPNGFIRIDYSAEGTEYSATTQAYQPARAADPDASPPVTARDPIPGRKGDDLDTHGRLTIVSATLDGTDISGDISANTDGNIFQYHLDGMAVDDYDLEITVRDEAGNQNAAPHKGTIKIIERKPYKLTLNPGWNLVSLPGQPADTDINEVIPSDHPIDAVRGYDPMVPGAWLIAEEGGDGTFTGTLETIESGTAYWIKTGAFQALDVDIPKPTPGSLSLLPTISISQGWNLVPILDVDGDFELAEQTADDNYFSGLTAGSVAAIYTYNTVTNSWTSVDASKDDPDDLSEGVKLGKGYWVYATKPGVIVP